MTQTALRRVLVVGGTHGNERIGIAIVNRLARSEGFSRFANLDIQTLIANPIAAAANTRYVDQDLNRSFSNVGSAPEANYEAQRAVELKRRFGFGSEAIDVVIDLHSSTANMGVTLLIDEESRATLGLAAHLQAVCADIRVYSSVGTARSKESIRSLGKIGIALEVGPIAHGTILAELLVQTETALKAILQYLNQLPEGNEFETAHQAVELYRYAASLNYPRGNRGELEAVIHPQRQFQDYQPLTPGTPLFLEFDGSTIPYEGEETLFPVFINEAAYYEKGIALILTRRCLIERTSMK